MVAMATPRSCDCLSLNRCGPAEGELQPSRCLQRSLHTSQLLKPDLFPQVCATKRIRQHQSDNCNSGMYHVLIFEPCTQQCRASCVAASQPAAPLMNNGKCAQPADFWVKGLKKVSVHATASHRRRGAKSCVCCYCRFKNGQFSLRNKIHPKQ